eukprot:1080790-Lingulodinium_polyedra.AAC.1
MGPGCRVVKCTLARRVQHHIPFNRNGVIQANRAVVPTAVQQYLGQPCCQLAQRPVPPAEAVHSQEPFHASGIH